MNLMQKIEKDLIPQTSYKFSPGDTIRVFFKSLEGDKKKLSVFEGTVIRKRSSGMGSSFTVRKITYGIGVERIFPLFSPNLQKVEVVNKGDVRRAKLYYLRDLKGKKAKVKIKLKASTVTTDVTNAQQ
jgi:large subunit ribosomal protein L19